MSLLIASAMPVLQLQQLTAHGVPLEPGQTALPHVAEVSSTVIGSRPLWRQMEGYALVAAEKPALATLLHVVCCAAVPPTLRDATPKNLCWNQMRDTYELCSLCWNQMRDTYELCRLRSP